jgi:hypothetical protein
MKVGPVEFPWIFFEAGVPQTLLLPLLITNAELNNTCDDPLLIYGCDHSTWNPADSSSSGLEL